MTGPGAPGPGRTLVAGVGNIFLGDDGFGPEVARRLAGAALPAGVRVADYGTSGMHLAYDLAGYDTVILIDAAPRGEVPGTVTVLARGDDPPEPPGITGSAGPASGGPGLTSPIARGDDPPEPPGITGAAGHPLRGRPPSPGEMARGDDPPEPPANSPVEISRLFDGHGMPPDVVLNVLGRLGTQAIRVLVVCCEPASIDYRIGLSEPVAAAVDEAARVVTGLLTAPGGVAAAGGRPAGGRPAAVTRAYDE